MAPLDAAAFLDSGIEHTVVIRCGGIDRRGFRPLKRGGLVVQSRSGLVSGELERFDRWGFGFCKHGVHFTRVTRARKDRLGERSKRQRKIVTSDCRAMRHFP
jgi:hypothetical protein